MECRRLPQVSVSVWNSHLIIIVIIIVAAVVVVVADVIRICNGIIVFSEKGIAAITKSVAVIVVVHAKRLNTRSPVFLSHSLTLQLSMCVLIYVYKNLAPDTAFKLKVILL